MPNRLSLETSPYLLQHARNPVDWFPWGEEALGQAEAEDKPIFLSIGYSACHWCHVMERESFEDHAIATILNDHFVSIKVDREERPDLDSIYMSAVQALTGRGGWPMSVFLTADGRPFYGGTYFPPQERYGMPSFGDVLRAIALAWRGRRDELLVGAEKVLDAIRAGQSGSLSAPIAGRSATATIDLAYDQLRDSFDERQGGWGGAPKFPQPMALEFLLRYHHSTGAGRALEMVSQTLEAMARGGVYDQLGGGFHRYSVDAQWLVPHFEKMLYDNAQLTRVYLHAWQVTGSGFFRAITEEILDYVVREMTDPSGGFYSTQDADSEGEEGKFFVWTPDEMRDVLRSETAEFSAAYGATDRGNFEGKNILELTGDLGRREDLSHARGKLFAAREARVHPGRDQKVITAWNGLMLAAFAEAARSLARDDYRKVAERNAEFILGALVREEGRLLRTWTAGEARLNGYLEDYAYTVEGLLELYQTTFQFRWYAAAAGLVETMMSRYRSPEGGFFDTSDDHELLITRPRDLQDNATPSGNAMAAAVLLKLAGLARDDHYRDGAQRALSLVQSMMAQYPLGFGQWLQALTYATSPPREIAIIGDPSAADSAALIGVARKGYQPFQVVAAGPPSAPTKMVPMLRDRAKMDGRATAYVCAGYTCRQPVVESDELARLLEE